MFTSSSSQEPRSGMMRAECSGGDREVDAGRAVQLRDDDALGAVHDELAAAEHDRDVAEVDVFLDDFRAAFARHAQLHAQRHAVGQAQLAALVFRVLRFAEVVVDVLDLHRVVVARDGEDLAQQALEAHERIAVGGILAQLEEALVRVALDAIEGRDRDGIAAL